MLDDNTNTHGPEHYNSLPPGGFDRVEPQHDAGVQPTHHDAEARRRESADSPLPQHGAPTPNVVPVVPRDGQPIEYDAAPFSGAAAQQGTTLIGFDKMPTGGFDGTAPSGATGVANRPTTAPH
jgi:hypothetical protein